MSAQIKCMYMRPSFLHNIQGNFNERTENTFFFLLKSVKTETAKNVMAMI